MSFSVPIYRTPKTHEIQTIPVLADIIASAPHTYRKSTAASVVKWYFSVRTAICRRSTTKRRSSGASTYVTSGTSATGTVCGLDDDHVNANQALMCRSCYSPFLSSSARDPHVAAERPTATTAWQAPRPPSTTARWSTTVWRRYYLTKAPSPSILLHRGQIPEIDRFVDRSSPLTIK